MKLHVDTPKGTPERVVLEIGTNEAEEMVADLRKVLSALPRVQEMDGDGGYVVIDDTVGPRDRLTDLVVRLHAAVTAPAAHGTMEAVREALGGAGTRAGEAVRK